MIELAGAFALVAGNAEDLGHAIVVELLDAGMRVAVLDDDAAALAAFTDRLRAAGGDVHGVPTDFRDPAAVSAAAEQTVRRHGAPRFLAHNAAIFRETPLAELSHAEFRAESDSILHSAFATAKAVWPAMVEAGSGSMAFVSSGSALRGFVGEAAYVAGKHGQEGLMKVLALEGEPHGIAVNTITTGVPIDGPLAYTYSEAMRAVMVPPAAIAPAFAFLAAADAAFATGQRFNAHHISQAMRMADAARRPHVRSSR